MKFAKVRSVISPQYANIGEDAGIDFYIPQFNEDFKQYLIKKNTQINTLQWEINLQNKTITIYPLGRILIPSGIKVNFSKNRALIANNKSGILAKKGLFSSGVIDHNYQGQVHIQLINTSNNKVEIKQNQKIVQYILFVIDNNTLQQVDISQLYQNKSKRGTGGFGSTK